MILVGLTMRSKSVNSRQTNEYDEYAMTVLVRVNSEVATITNITENIIYFEI